MKNLEVHNSLTHKDDCLWSLNSTKKHNFDPQILFTKDLEETVLQMCQRKGSQQIVHQYEVFRVIMHWTICIMLCASCSAHYAICTVHCALLQYALCTVHSVCMLTRSITGVAALCGLTRVTRLVHYTRIWATLYVRLALYRWEGGGPRPRGRGDNMRLPGYKRQTEFSIHAHAMLCFLHFPLKHCALWTGLMSNRVWSENRMSQGGGLIWPGGWIFHNSH